MSAKKALVIFIILIAVLELVGIGLFVNEQFQPSICNVKVADWCECDVYAFNTTIDTKCLATFIYEGREVCSMEGEEENAGKLHLFILPKEATNIVIQLTSTTGRVAKYDWSELMK